jgi:hypothetical protein
MEHYVVFSLSVFLTVYGIPLIAGSVIFSVIFCIIFRIMIDSIRAKAVADTASAISSSVAKEVKDTQEYIDKKRHLSLGSLKALQLKCYI